MVTLTHVDLAVGRMSTFPRASAEIPVHLTVPLVIGDAAGVVAHLELSRPAAFVTHVNGIFGPWSCHTADRAGTAIDCVLPAGSVSTTLGIDLGLTHVATVTVTVTATHNRDPDRSNNSRTRRLPTS